jgi:hypothetical protein
MTDPPANCQRCDAPLEGAYTAIGRGDEVEYICRTCDRHERITSYQETGVLTTSLVIDASLVAHEVTKDARGSYVDLAIWLRSEFVCMAIMRFDKMVWHRGMKDVIRKSKKKGMSAELHPGGVKFLSFCMCARCMMTIEHPDGHSITMMVTETDDKSHCFLRGINAKPFEAIELRADRFSHQLLVEGRAGTGR